MKFNWEDIETGESKYIDEEGTYTLKVIDFESSVTANNNECHNYTCETKEGKQIRVDLYLVDKALWKYKAFASACGLNTEGACDTEELPKLLLGKKFIGEVTRKPDRINIETGMPEQSKYFEVKKYHRIEG